jgi:type VI secretion system protein ImpL
MMRWFFIFAHWFEKVPGLDKRWLRYLVATVVLICGVLFSIKLMMFAVQKLPIKFWQVVAISVLLVAIVWWFTRGAKRFEQRGLNRKHLGDLGPGNPEDEADPVRMMQQTIKEATSFVSRSPELEGGRNPLYRVPWFLVLGDDDSGKLGLLQAASRTSPFPPPNHAGAHSLVWRWWFFRQMIAIQTSEKLVCDPAARLERGVWYRALQLLESNRSEMPLNGILVCVSATAIARNDETFRTHCMWLRRLVDETMEHLHLQLPVYFVVTHLDELAGFAQFFGALPKEAGRQALGARLETQVRTSAASIARIGDIFETMHERLHALRLTALRTEPLAAQRKGIFDFVESFRTLRPGLETFVRVLLEDNPFLRTPQWRGVYFAATGSQPAFVEDLFTRFLPVDQPLAVKNARRSFWRWSAAALGAVALIALSAYVAGGIVNAVRQDNMMSEKMAQACQTPQAVTGPARITWVASCGREIDSVEAIADSAPLSFGLRASDRKLRELRQTLVQDFSRLILAPYDQTLEQEVHAGRIGLEHYLAICQRLRLVADCRSDAKTCRRDALAANYVFDPYSGLFAPFRVAGTAQQAHAQAQDLLQAYIGYIRWQDPALLHEEENRLRTQLAAMVSSHRLEGADVTRWAAARPNQLALATLWLPASEASAIGRTDLPAMPDAFTRTAWVRGIAPLVDQLIEYFPERKAAFALFFESYQREYFRRWGQFLKLVPQGVALWKGREDQLIGRAAGRDSPYSALWAALDEHIYGLPISIPGRTRWSVAWSQIKDEPSSTHRALWHFVAGSFTFAASGVLLPPAWIPAVLDYRYRVLGSQRAAYAKAYLRLQGDNAGQESYAVASEVFKSNGNPSQPPAAEYAPLLQSVDKPDEKFATGFTPDDQSAWSIVQGPSRLLLTLTVHRAAQFLQAKWQESVLAPLSALPESEQLNALYGEGGRMSGFINDWLKPFVSEKEKQPIKIAGVTLPLATNYQALVNQGHSVAPLLDGSKPFFAGAFQFTQPSTFGKLQEGGSGSRLELDCKERLFVASTRGEALSDAKASVFWSPQSCLEARIRVGLPDMPKAPPASAGANAAVAVPVAFDPNAGPRLTKTYAGKEGFVALLQDFRDGAHTFAMGDFRKSYAPAQWQEIADKAAALGVRDVRVYLQVNLSDEMKRYLSGRGAVTRVPAQLFE